jgi:diguanylate cyclase (GGDEF)-like protein/PAS domain S-box-containing protein
MTGQYDLWLVAGAFTMALAASFVALELAHRVARVQGRGAWAWLAGGAVALGLGIWSMHFVGMLAFHLPIPLAYDPLITAISALPAILASGLMLHMFYRGRFNRMRIAAASLTMGLGIAAMHYTGMAAIPVVPSIRYDPALVALSVAIAILVAFAALKLLVAFSSSRSFLHKMLAALLMATAICAMHFTGMAAAQFSPDSVCIVPAGSFDNLTLAAIVASNTLAVLLVTIGLAVYDSRTEERDRRHMENLNRINEELRERTRRAERLASALESNQKALLQFRAAVETSADAMFLVDRETLRYVDCNETACQLLGYSREEILRLGPAELNVDPEEQMASAFDDAVPIGSKGVGARADRRLARRKDGVVLPLEVRRTAVSVGGRRIIVSVARDISEREQQERALRDSEAAATLAREQLRLALVASKRALFDWHVASGEVFLDERWAEIVGGEAGAMRTTIGVLRARVHPEDVGEVDRKVRAVVKGETQFYEVEHRVRSEGGEYVWIQSQGKVVERDPSGRAIRVSGTNADISGRKRAERDLLSAHENLARGMAALERRNREMQILAELNGLLLTCVSMDEACAAIPKFAEQLFTRARGALFLVDSSGARLGLSVAWGDHPEDWSSLSPSECWALRRGRIYGVSDQARAPACQHLAGRDLAGGYVCVPLQLQGELFGLVSLAYAQATEEIDEAAQIEQRREQLASVFSEQVALALSNIRLRDDLRQQTVRDPLTGLYNRRYLDESMNRELARGQRTGAAFTVLVIDVDHFKRINDGFGHDAGDAVLKRLALALSDGAREGDVICRYGGEEFVMLLCDTEPSGGEQLGLRVLQRVRELRVEHGGKDIGALSVSIGLAAFPLHAQTKEALIGAADGALYRAKSAGRDRLMVVEAIGQPPPLEPLRERS